MSNLARATDLVGELKSIGVVDFVVCGGSRNAPLIAALGGSKSYTFVDERAAAFFALGRVKRDGRPVAVLTTSGTAVAELLPATIEAFYSAAPLILVTADRPARYRGTGAPQTIDQIGIFGAYAAEGFAEWNRQMPIHINIEFDEPLIDE